MRKREGEKKESRRKSAKAARALFEHLRIRRSISHDTIRLAFFVREQARSNAIMAVVVIHMHASTWMHARTRRQRHVHGSLASGEVHMPGPGAHGLKMHMLVTPAYLSLQY